MRHWVAVFFIPALLSTLGLTARACELPRTSDGDAPALLHKPLVGENVVFVTGFGVRLDPLIGRRMMHAGIDWSSAAGAPVISAGPGRVTAIALAGPYGGTITIDHGRGWQTLYGHLSRIAVAEGDCVDRGDVVGAIGSAGHSGGPTLHFEVHREGRPVDPMSMPAP